ncbi:biological adhesion [Branchiostoma belcheri]|nr:biological adhesion [Branchiostoma belcheri]
MFSRLVRLLVLLLMESGSVSSWCADCAHAEYCRDKGLKRVPQDLPASVDCLECGKNAIVSLTQSDFSRNLTVESGGRVTVEANFNIAIENITTTDSGLYVCLAASPVGSTSAKLSIYVHGPASVSSTSVHVHGPASVSSTSAHVHGPASLTIAYVTNFELNHEYTHHTYLSADVWVRVTRHLVSANDWYCNGTFFIVRPPSPS